LATVALLAAVYYFCAVFICDKLYVMQVVLSGTSFDIFMCVTVSVWCVFTAS